MRTLMFVTMLTLAAPASAMPVAEMIAKADALEKKGMMAMFSPDLKKLMNEGKTAATQLRDERLADIKAGRKPGFCPPEKSSMNSTEVMKHLRTIPVADRGMSFKTALAGLMRKKYPCPA